MTSQKDQIQRLIAEIEATLAKPSARLPLGLSGEAERQRQLLGKLFSYLQSVQQTFDSPGGWGPIDPGTGQFVSPKATSPDVEESASQVLQGLLLEMSYLKENSLKPMRQELESLQQKRDSLQAEINVLDAQRGAGPLQSEQQISAFLETLMQRLQEQLSAQMVQNFAAMESAAVEQLSAADTPELMLSDQRLEQVRLLQAQSDQLLLKLDSTLTAVFDSLQKSVDSYRESLEEGLDQMHGLGRQGEVIFHAFINHLAQQLGQDASSFLTGELSKTGQQSALQEPGAVTTEVDLNATQLDELDQALENLALEESLEAGPADALLEIDSDLALLEDAISPDDEADEETEEDITLIQTDDASELALLEDAISFDEDITVIQTDSDLNLEVELDEEITLIQGDDAFGSVGEMPEASEDTSEELLADLDETVDLDNPLPILEEDTATSLETTPASLSLDLSLEDADESFGLLAVGAENSELLNREATKTEQEQDDLPSAASENELFKFDIDPDFDLGLEPREVAEESDELLVGALFPESAESDLPDANQIADDWLFNQLPTDDDPKDRDVIPEVTDEDIIPEATVETLFGDSLSTQDDVGNEGPDSDTIASLSELLPDEQVPEVAEDFPENLPDDIYIPASADEDLINLVESDAEQRLLIDFDDGPLVEQLDEDLQKLAGANLSATDDYQIEQDNALEPLDQATLETIVRDLNLEDLNLETESDPVEADKSESETSQDPSLTMAEAESDNDAEAAVLSESSDDETDFDLFEGFATDAIDVDDPSADEIDVASLTSLSLTDLEPETQDLDLLSLVTDALIDETDELDDFDDGIPDSLADELGGLSERSTVLSQEQADDVVGQLLSDLEEPVIESEEILEVPAVEATEPHLDSASVPDVPPDVPSDFWVEEDQTAASPEADDFLQAEQEAFWRTMDEDEDRPQPPFSTGADSSNRADVLDASETVSDTSDDMADMALDAESISAADELNDFLVLDDLPLPSQSSDEPDIDLKGLDDLFGQSSVPELELPEQDLPSVDDDEKFINSLAASELEVVTPLEIAVPEAVPDDDISLIPDVDALLASPASMELVDTEASSDEFNGVPVERLADGSFETQIESETPAPPVSIPPEITPSLDIEGDWFLGLDIGATGLSAVLMNRRTGQVYPLYWQIAEDLETKHFRLPATALMTSAQETLAVGYDALGDLEGLLDTSGAKMPELLGIDRLKPLLKVAVGHGQTLPNSDPWLRWSDTVEVPMLQVLQAMVALLSYVVNQGKAVGLEGDGLNQIWEKLQGVIVGYPTNWPDTYSFNLREAILAAGLINQPEQILFVEDAIATILSGLPDPNEVSIAEAVSLSRQPSLYNCQWQEGTVVISGGAVMTELGLVNLPKDLTHLNYADFALRGFAYAGDALDQDIVCQLLLPEERRQTLSESDDGTNWDWQGHLASEDADWSQLRLDHLTLPTVGHVDWVQRYRLQQRLLGSSLGQSLLAAARHLKLALQQQNQIQITLAGQRWLIKRRHLENVIFLPYIQRINRYLNVLLSHHAVDTQAIKQVICTGGSASLPAIARWLRQKFPNATIIQDTYASELPHSCSRVAYGLVNLARYPQVLNVTRQQYSDYFLLMELLRVFPQQPLPVGAIMHLLEQRGVNTQACHLHILALLEGHLPPGLVPTTADRGLISDRTRDLSTYRALLQTPLFSKTVTESGAQMYIPNEAQAKQLRAYVNRLLINKAQTLEEPLLAHLEVSV